MAQIVKLKRSSTGGKVPTTSNLELGELAMNTYDGRIFFEKNTDGTVTIEEIVTTDAERPITGSINLNGNFYASSFNGTALFSSSQQVDYNSIQNQPTIPTVNNGTLTVQGTGVLGGTGTFTANSSSSPTISITHDAVSRTNNTSTASPSHGDTFTAIDSITTSNEGHVTAVNTKTVTLPSQGSNDDVSVANLETRLAQIDSDINVGDSTGRTFTFRDNIIVTGNLTVSGNTTTTTSETLNIEDNLITLNSNITGTPSENGGIEVERGTSTNSSIIWDESTDKWKAGLSGSEYEILTSNSDTDDLTEGSSNLYYTSTRFNSDFSGKTTDNLNEGSSALYYTDDRVKAKLNNDNVLSGSIVNQLPAGTISGSDQVQFGSISNKPNIFSTISVGGTDLSADSTSDTLSITAGSNITLTPNASTDTFEIAATNTTYSSGTGLSLSGTVFSFDGNGTGVVSGSVLRSLNGTGVISGSVLRPNGDSVVSSSAQVNTLYSSAVSKVTSGEISAGTETGVRRYSPADIKDFIDGHPSTNTTYDLSVQTGGANTSVIRLAGSDSTNDDVTISGGTGITITESGNTITITGTAQYGDSDVLSYINGLSVFSSSQQVDYDSIQNQPTIPNAIFKTIAVSGQNNVVADSSTDTLTFVAGNNVTITTDNTADSVTVNATNTTYTAGTGLGLSGTEFSFNGSGTGIVSGSVLRPNGDGVISGSVLRPNGDNVISQSQQVDYNNIQNTPTIGNGTLTVQGTGILGGSGTFTANQAGGETISITHDTITPTANTSTASPSHGGTFTVIDSITFNTTGHPTAYNTKTITLPSDSNTTYSAGTGLDLSGTTFNFDGNGTGVVSQSAQIDHDQTTNFVANEHIDHSSITIGSGKGLSGGGTITTSRSLTLNTGSAHFTDGVVGALPGGTISGSGQLPSGLVSQSAQINGQSVGSPAAIYDNSGTPTLRSGITAAEVRTAIGVDAAGTNNYTHPTFDGDDIDIDTTALSGATVISDLDINITTDSNGHVTDANGSVSTRTITKSDIGLGNVENTQLSTYTGQDGALDNQYIANGAGYLTAHPSITQGNNISSNNSNGTVIQDLTITLDSNGHVTTATAGTVNLDGRYYTETESNTLFTKKLGQGIVSQSAQINAQSTSNPAAIYDNSGTPTLRTGITQGELQTAIGVDAAGTDNSTNVSLAGSYDYITISGQTITRNQVDASTDISNLTTTNVSEGTNKYATTANVKTALNANLGSATFGDSNDTITIPGNLVVSGTTTTNNVEVVSTSNGIVFEGNAADDNEITLLAGTVSADRTITLPDADGTLPLLGIDQTFSGANTFSSQIVSSVAQGTAPFSVSSTTKVANLNADLVDGLSAAAFIRSNASDTASGVITFSNTTNSTSKTTGGVIISGGVGIAKTLNVGEDVVAYASSDERYKDNVTPIENPNEKLKQIGGYTFDWNDKHEVFKGQHDVGVIAQEIEKVLPEIVETRESGYKAVKYEKIVALLIESNKELLKRVEELESKLK